MQWITTGKVLLSEVFYGEDGETDLVEISEGGINAPIAGNSEKGKLVSMGMATEAPTEELKAAVSGNIAFIQRGENPFCEKGEFAIAAGATAFVVYNNAPGAPISMGGACQLAIPGLMITLEAGEKILEAMQSQDVSFVMDSGKSFRVS